MNKLQMRRVSISPSYRTHDDAYNNTPRAQIMADMTKPAIRNISSQDVMETSIH